MKKRGLLLVVGVCLLIAVLILLPNETHASEVAGLDYGLYWFGNGNVSQKFVKGAQNPYYDPSKPTVIYVHGWQKDSVPSQKRETFNYKKNDATYGIDVNAADAWIKAGWNIGIFYWDQFADETDVVFAEAKIWSVNGPKGMQWRKKDGTYSTAGNFTKSVGELFYDTYVEALSDYKGNNIRIAGHSLGNQMATRLTYLVSQGIDRNEIPARLLPTRVALLDPFWSKNGKDYLGGAWTGERVRQYVGELKQKNVIFEQYKSTGIADVGLGDSNSQLEKMTAFTSLRPWFIPSWDIAGKHVAAPNLYFLSFNSKPPVECTISWGTRKTTGNVAASASTSDVRIREMMNSSYQWDQVEGRNTVSTDDDWFERKSR